MSKNQLKSGIFELIRYVLVGFIALFPIILFKGYLYNGTSSRAIFLMIVIEILAIIFAISLFNKNREVKLFKSPIALVLSMYFIVLVLAGLNGVDPSMSFWSKAARVSGIFFFSHLVMLYYFLSYLFKDEEVQRGFLKVFAVSSGIFSVLSFLGPEGLGFIFKTKLWDGFTFGNSTFAAMYLFAAFLISIYLVRSTESSEKKWWHRLLPVAFFINPYIINHKVWKGQIDLIANPMGIVGEARAGAYVLAISLFALIIFYFGSKISSAKIRRGLIWGALVITLVSSVVLIRSFLAEDGYLRGVYLSQATSARPIVWELSTNMIKERPLLGWGTDNFDRGFEQNYDNRLLEERFGNEAWFDRAHNVFIDQAVDTGYIGLSFYLLVYFVVLDSLVYVLLKSKEKNDQLLASILIIYFLGHLAELQTAFDTTISLVAVLIMIALSSNLYRKTYIESNKDKKHTINLPVYVKYGAAVCLIGYFGWAFFAGALPIARAEHINGTIRTVGSAEKRLPMYPVLFGSPMDLPSFLWRTSTDFQRGISENPASIENPKNQENFKKELEIFANEYKNYLDNHPNDIRAHFNYADVLMYSNLLGVNRLEEASVVLDKAIEMNPEIPQGYWMKSVLSLYQGKFDLAREWAQKGLAINPGIEKSQQIVSYIDKNIKSFPEVSLYFFDKI